MADMVFISGGIIGALVGNDWKVSPKPSHFNFEIWAEKFIYHIYCWLFD